MKRSEQKKNLVLFSVVAIFGLVLIFVQNPSGGGLLSVPSSFGLSKQSCIHTTTETGFLVYADGSSIVACNTKTGKIEHSGTEPGAAVAYAIANLDRNRTAPQMITISGNFDNVSTPIKTTSNLHLRFIGLYKLAPNYQYNAIINDEKVTEKNIVIDGSGTLDCNVENASKVISGTYLVGLDTYEFSDIEFQNCPHVGLYTKGGINGSVHDIVSHDSISKGPAVGTSFAFFGGANNQYRNLVAYGACGPLGNGFQIEANDESIGPDYFRQNTMTNIQAHDNCGNNFSASNTAEGNVVSQFKFWNAGKENIKTENGRGITFSNGEIYNAGQNYYNVYISQYIAQVDNTKIYSTDGKTKGGIYFENNPSLPYLTVDSTTFRDLPVGVHVAGQNVTVKNSCHANVGQFILKEPTGTVTESGNGPCQPLLSIFG